VLYDRAVRPGRATNLKMGHKFEADRKMRVAVVGGGPSGACAAEIFAQVPMHLLSLRIFLSCVACGFSLVCYTGGRDEDLFRSKIACQPPGDAMRHDFAPLALSHHLYVPFLQEKNMETYMFERKMDNCKPCGGAIPLCMIDEFKLPEKIVDRKVRRQSLRLVLSRAFDRQHTT
jgi:hypothetical protein